MKKICLLTCGGTMTMKRDKKGVLVPFHSDDQLLVKIPELTKIAKITIENVTNIDSTNMHPDIWTKLAQKIKENYSLYDGFVITHGTDTMAYSASALSFALQKINKPIVFTGAQKPLDDLTSDGRNNLLNALFVACMDLREVCIVFGSKILRGNRATKTSESNLDAFDSPMEAPLGEVRLEPKLVSLQNRTYADSKLSFQPHYNPNIIVIEVHPGLPCTFLEKIIQSGCEGIILKAFGAGNIPDQLIPALQRANKLHIPVIILSQCSQGMTQMQLYQVGYQTLEAGAIPGGDMTLEVTVAKLMWVLAYTKDLKEIKKVFSISLAGEMTTAN